MSRDLEEIREIRREKANLDKLIRSYQRRSEELRAREASLMRKMEALEPRIIYWKMFEEKQNADGYTVSDPTLEMFKLVETAQRNMENISKLREEVLQKQYENLKLKKVLEARKEEHRKFYEELDNRKTSLGQCVTGECADLDGPSQEIQGSKSAEPPKDSSETSDDEVEDEMKLWHEIGGKFDL